MTTDIKELYRQRREYCLEEKSKAQDIIAKLMMIKCDIEKKYLEKAKGDAEAYFNCAHSGELLEAQRILSSAEIELRLLKCPDDSLHEKHEGQYYHCKLCGFVWDDTSPAHF